MKEKTVSHSLSLPVRLGISDRKLQTSSYRGVYFFLITLLMLTFSYGWFFLFLCFVCTVKSFGPSSFSPSRVCFSSSSDHFRPCSCLVLSMSSAGGGEYHLLADGRSTGPTHSSENPAPPPAAAAAVEAGMQRATSKRDVELLDRQRWADKHMQQQAQRRASEIKTHAAARSVSKARQQSAARAAQQQ